METCGDYGGITEHGDPCGKPEGWGRPDDTGPCKYHVNISDGNLPPAPDAFDEEAEWFWNKIGPMLYKEGYLKEIDFPFFEQVCESYGLARNAYKTIQEEGRTVSDEAHGGVKRHPEMLNYKQMASQFEKEAGKLGMNVNARMAINLPDEDQEPSEMEKILADS